MLRTVVGMLGGKGSTERKQRGDSSSVLGSSVREETALATCACCSDVPDCPNAQLPIQMTETWTN